MELQQLCIWSVGSRLVFNLCVKSFSRITSQQCITALYIQFTLNYELNLCLELDIVVQLFDFSDVPAHWHLLVDLDSGLQSPKHTFYCLSPLIPLSFYLGSH